MIVIQHIDNQCYTTKNTGVTVYLAEAMKYGSKEEAEKARLTFDRPKHWRVVEADEKQVGVVDQNRKKAIWGNASDAEIAQAKNEIMDFARANIPMLR
jgi:hypothetical protein